MIAMSNLMMVHRDCYEEWLSNKSVKAQLATQRLAKMQSSKVGSWLDQQAKHAEGGDFERRGSVALINCVGMLQYKFSLLAWLYDSSCYVGIINRLQAAADDSTIKKIVLYCDSPGGMNQGLIEASDAVWQARQAKEVVAVVDPEAASAAYWLASQASRIVGLESGWVGSVGSQVFLYSEHRYLQELGVDVELIRSKVSPNKNLGQPYEPISDAARVERQGWVDQAGNAFVDHVARGRGHSHDYIVENYGQGSMYFMRDAMDRGMVDSIGSLQDELSAVAA